MHNVAFMEISKRHQYLSDYNRGLDVTQSPAFILDKGEQVACRHKILK